MKIMKKFNLSFYIITNALSCTLKKNIITLYKTLMSSNSMLAILLLALNQWNSTIKSKNISLTHVCRERHQGVSFASLYANLYLLHCGA